MEIIIKDKRLIYADRHFVGLYEQGLIYWYHDCPVYLTLKDLQNIVIALENL
jgi:hypothetical protein